MVRATSLEEQCVISGELGWNIGHAELSRQHAVQVVGDSLTRLGVVNLEAIEGWNEFEVRYQDYEYAPHLDYFFNGAFDIAARGILHRERFPSEARPEIGTAQNLNSLMRGAESHGHAHRSMKGQIRRILTDQLIIAENHDSQGAVEYLEGVMGYGDFNNVLTSARELVRHARLAQRKGFGIPSENRRRSH